MSSPAAEGTAAQPAADRRPLAHTAPREPAAWSSRYLALDDFEVAARRRLPRMLHGYIAGSAETGAAFRDNRASFSAYALVPRVLIDTRGRSQAATLFGRRYAAPFGIAPLGAAALSAYRGDIALARAAATVGIPMILSASSLIAMEDVAAAGASWFQAYVPGDSARIEALLTRAGRAGFETLVVTADVPVAANRENNLRNGFSLPVVPSARLCWQALTHPRWLLGTALPTWLRHGMPRFENLDATAGAPILSRRVVRELGQRDRLSWEHLRQIRRQWRGTLVVKGILSLEDARLAREAGADGIILSNHGGRQLDSAVAPLRVLPQIAAEKAGMAVMLDGGVRRGTDVLKALALGADFVFIGRPFVFAAALGGTRLVSNAARLLSAEIDRDMALMGLTELQQLGPDKLLRIDGR